MMLRTKSKRLTALVTAIIMFTTVFLGSIPVLVFAEPATGTGVNTYTIRYKAAVKRSNGIEDTVSDTVTISDKYIYHSITKDSLEFVKVLEIMDTSDNVVVIDNEVRDEDDRQGIIRTDKVMALVENGVLYVKPAKYRATSIIDKFKYTVKGEGTAEPVFKVDYSLALTGTHPASAPEGDVTDKKARSSRSLNILNWDPEEYVQKVKLPDGYIIDMSRIGSIDKVDASKCSGYNGNTTEPKAKGYSERIASSTGLVERKIEYSGFDSNLGGFTQLTITHKLKNVFLSTEHCESIITIYASKPTPGTVLFDGAGTSNYESKGSFIIKSNTTMGANIIDIKELKKYDPDMKLTLDNITSDGQTGSKYPLEVGDYYTNFTSKNSWKENEFSYMLNLKISQAVFDEATNQYISAGEQISVDAERKCAKLIPNKNGDIMFEKVDSKNFLGADFSFILREEAYEKDAQGNVIEFDGKPKAKTKRTAHFSASVVQRADAIIKEKPHTFAYINNGNNIGKTPQKLDIFELIDGKTEPKQYIDFLAGRSSDAEYMLVSISALAMHNGAEFEAEIKDNSLLDLDSGEGVIDLGGLTLNVYAKDASIKVGANTRTKRVGVANACTLNFIPKAKIASINDELNEKQVVKVQSGDLVWIVGQGTPSEQAYIVNEHNLKSNLEAEEVIFDVTPNYSGSGYTGTLRNENIGASAKLVGENNANEVEFLLNHGDNPLKSGVHKLYYKVRQDVGADQFWSPDAVGFLRVNQPPIVYITDVEGAGYVKGEKYVIEGKVFSDTTPFYSTNPNQTVAIKADALSVDGDEIVSRHWYIYESEAVEIDDGEGGKYIEWMINSNNPIEVTPENKSSLNIESYNDNELKIKFNKVGFHGIGYVAVDEFGEKSNAEVIELRVLPEPVLLIHGYLSSPGQMKKISNDLTSKGFEVDCVDLRKAPLLGIDTGVNLLSLLDKNCNENITIANVWSKVVKEGFPKIFPKDLVIDGIDPNAKGLSASDKAKYSIAYAKAFLTPWVTSMKLNDKPLISFVGTDIDTLLGKKYSTYFDEGRANELLVKTKYINDAYEHYKKAILGSGKDSSDFILNRLDNEAKIVEKLNNPNINLASELDTARKQYLGIFKIMLEGIKYKDHKVDLATPIMKDEENVHKMFVKEIEALARSYKAGGDLDATITKLNVIYKDRADRCWEIFKETLDNMHKSDLHNELFKIDKYYMLDPKAKLERFLSELWDDIFQYSRKDKPFKEQQVSPGMTQLDVKEYAEKINFAYKTLTNQNQGLWDVNKVFGNKVSLKDFKLGEVKVPNPLSTLLGNDIKGRIISFVIGKIFGSIKLDLLSIPLRFPINPKIKIGDTYLRILASVGAEIKLVGIDFSSEVMDLKIGASLNFQLEKMYWDVDSKVFNKFLAIGTKMIGSEEGFYFVDNYDSSNVHFAALDDGDVIRGISPMLSTVIVEPSDDGKPNTSVGNTLGEIGIKIIYKLLFNQPWRVGYSFGNKKAKEDAADDEDAVFSFKGMMGIEGQGALVSFMGVRLGVYANLPFLKFANAPINGYTREVDLAVKKLLDRTRPDGKLTIIGKDMGGLVARHYAQSESGQHVKRLILLATPNFGFSWANYGPKLINLGSEAIRIFANGFRWVAMLIDVGSNIILGSAIHDMAPHSAFLGSLNGGSSICEDSKLDDREIPHNGYVINNIYGTSGLLTVSHKHLNLGPLGELSLPWIRKGDWVVAGTSASANNVINHEVKSSFIAMHRSDEVLDIISHIIAGDERYKEMKVLAFEESGAHLASEDDKCMCLLAGAVGQDYNGSPYQESLIVKNEKVRKGGTKTAFYKVDSSMKEIVITQNWSAGDTDVMVVAPDGRKVGGSTGATFGGAVYDKYADINAMQVVVQNPQQGEWKIVTTGVEEPESGNDIFYSVTVGFTTDMSVAIGTDRTSYRPNESVAIKVYAFNGKDIASSAARNVVLDAKVTKPSGVAERIQLYDDGQHNDGVAGDGVFGAQFSDTKMKGAYTVVATAKFSEDISECVRETSTEFEVNALANLKMFSDGITFERRGEDIPANQLDQIGSVYIKSVIKNQGDADIKGATINFYAGKPGDAGSKLIGTDKVDISVNNTAIARIRWTPEYETKAIYVAIDTINLPLQKDYQDKIASKEVKVKKLDIAKFNMKDMVVLKGMPVTFNATGTKIDIPNVTYEWNIDMENQGGFVGSAVRTGKIVVLPNGYSITDRPYKVQLTVKNGDTPVGRAQINVVVKDNFDKRSAIADAGREIFVSAGEDVHFDGSRSWSQFDITMFTWDIDARDGNDSVDLIGATPVLIGGYSEPGRYTVTLTINDAIGSGPITDEVVVNVREPELVIGGRTFKINDIGQTHMLDISVDGSEKLVLPVTVNNPPAGVTLYTFGQPFFVEFEDKGNGRGTITIQPVDENEISVGQNDTMFELVASDARGNRLSILINLTINHFGDSGVIEIHR